MSSPIQWLTIISQCRQYVNGSSPATGSGWRPRLAREGVWATAWSGLGQAGVGWGPSGDNFQAGLGWGFPLSGCPSRVFHVPAMVWAVRLVINPLLSARLSACVTAFCWAVHAWSGCLANKVRQVCQAVSCLLSVWAGWVLGSMPLTFPSGLGFRCPVILSATGCCQRPSTPSLSVWAVNLAGYWSSQALG